MSCEDVGYIRMAQESSDYAFVNTVKNFLCSLKTGN
jgi:hypothetical protein